MTVIQRLAEDGPAEAFAGTAGELSELARRSRDLRARLSLPADPFVIDGNQVRTQFVCGFVPLGNVTIEIKPRFVGELVEWRPVLLAMLAGNAGMNWHPRTDPDDPGASLPDLLGLVVVEALSRGAAEGVPRTYVEQQGDLVSVRGKPMPDAAWRRVLDPEVMRCRYTQFSENHPVNSVLKWTAIDLAGTVSRPWLAGELDMFSLSWPEAEARLPPSHVMDNLAPPPQFDFLSEAIDIGRLLASRPQAGSDGRHGGAGRSFIWSSREVMAQFTLLVARLAARELGGDAHSTRFDFATPTQVGKRMREVPARSDVIVEFEGRVRALFDVFGADEAAEALERDAEAVVAAGDWMGCPDVGIVRVGRRRGQVRRWRLRANRGPAHLHELSISVAGLADGQTLNQIAALFAEDLAHALLAVPIQAHHSRGSRANGAGLSERPARYRSVR